MWHSSEKNSFSPLQQSLVNSLGTGHCVLFHISFKSILYWINVSPQIQDELPLKILKCEDLLEVAHKCTFGSGRDVQNIFCLTRCVCQGSLHCPLNAQSTPILLNDIEFKLFIWKFKVFCILIMIISLKIRIFYQTSVFW